MFHWIGLIIGPKDTPYHNGYFYINIEFPQDYPFKPMKLKFTTKMYHCNITESGLLDLDVLHDNWSPALTMPKVLLSL